MTDLTLERRLTELEGEVAGEKIVTRHILEQLRVNTDVLLEMRREMLEFRKEMHGELLDIRKEMAALTQKVDGLSDRVALQGAQLVSFEANFAGIAADALREALRSRTER